jgi:hypothetical protein
LTPHFPARFSGSSLLPKQKLQGAMANHIRQGQKSALLRKSKIGRVKIATPQLNKPVASFNPKPGIY